MTDTAITGTCHCGAIRITVPRTPDFVNECNCTLCTKLGGLWCYFPEDAVRIEAAPGALAAYIRADLDETWLSTHHCTICGCTTHWTPLPERTLDRMGVNLRMFGDDVLAEVEVRKVDGRSQ